VWIQPLLAPARARFELPTSKSAANRVLIAAALSGRRVELGPLDSNADIEAVLNGLAVFGFSVERREAGVTLGPGPRRPHREGRIACGAAGTALRFLAALAALLPGRWELCGSARLAERPIEDLAAALRGLGAEVQRADAPGIGGESGASREAIEPDGAAERALLWIRGRPAEAPPPRRIGLDARLSSQFLSALLLVGAELGPEGLEIELSGPLASAEYAQLTARVLARFGVEVRREGALWRVRRIGAGAPQASAAATASARAMAGAAATAGAAGPSAAERLELPADWSAMGVWSCLAHATGSRIEAPGLDPDDGQPDARLAGLLAELDRPGPLELDVGACPDQFMNLAVLAAARSAPTRLTGAANLRHKESDRIERMRAALAALGAQVRAEPDGLWIAGRPARWRGALLDCAEDHRLAMAFALHGLLAGGVRLSGAECVAKSYPRFFEHLTALRAATRPVALVGQRSAGKSTLGRALAQATGARFMDTDALFAAAHGPIHAFVDAHGWEPFRDAEQRLLAEALAPGRVLALGGGALEREASRRLLAAQALAVWIDTPRELLLARLSLPGERRPAVLGGTLSAELDALEARRRPLFEAAAALRVDGALELDAQVEAVWSGLQALGRRERGA
jgi:3-phosphoshikimate 1-carboxyvinyltransferase